jgi:hypothetical protein
MAARRVSIYTATVALIVITGCDADHPILPPTGPPVSAPASPAPGGNTIPITIGGGQALGLAVHQGAVWAVSYDASTLSRIDPVTNQVTLTARLGVPVATIMSTGDGLWAASYVAGRTRIAVDRNAHTNVVYAGDSAWVSSDTTKLLRLKGGRAPAQPVDVGGGVPFLASGAKVWGASPTQVWAVDARTGRVTDRIDVPGSIEVISMAVTEDAVWAGIRRAGRVGAILEIDRATRAVRRELSEVSIPARMELTGDAVWVTDSGGDKVHRIPRE